MTLAQVACQYIHPIIHSFIPLFHSLLPSLIPLYTMLRAAIMCCAVLCCAVLCCAVLCCAVLCCAVLCCAVLCCAVLCCAVLCCTGSSLAHLVNEGANVFEKMIPQGLYSAANEMYSLLLRGPFLPHRRGRWLVMATSILMCGKKSYGRSLD